MTSTKNMPDGQDLCKILRLDELFILLTEGRFAGSRDDLSDGFIHLASRDQLTGTLAKHFGAEHPIFLVYCRLADDDPALRWEASRRGERFPHLYRGLALGEVLAIVPIPKDRAGWTPPRIIL